MTGPSEITLKRLETEAQWEKVTREEKLKIVSRTALGHVIKGKTVLDLELVTTAGSANGVWSPILARLLLLPTDEAIMISFEKN